MSLRDANVVLIDCDHRTPPAATDGYAYIAIPQLKGGRVDPSGARRISRSDFEDWTRKAKPQPYDVILSRRCNPGETAVASHDLEFALGQNLVILRSDGSVIDRAYLRWLVRGSDWWDQVSTFINVGAVFDSLRCADIPKFELPVPPLAEQRAIAHILGTLDDKIELNQRMNETLEAMARAHFKSWFVDFDPVRAKMEGRWRRGESLPGLPAEMWDLFPERLVDSELGEIPEGWEERSMLDCLTAARGLSYKGSGLTETHGIPMHNLNSLYEGGGYKRHGIKHYGGEFQEKHICTPGDVLVANTEQGHDRLLIGFAGIVPPVYGERTLFSHHLYRVRPAAECGLSPDYIEQLLNTRRWHEIVSGYSNGTTVNMLPLDAVRLPKLAVPPRALVGRFDAVAKAARCRHDTLETESEMLVGLRDTLLPKLISGELHVSDAERIAARVT